MDIKNEYGMKQLLAPCHNYPKSTFYYYKIVTTINDLISKDTLVLQNFKVCNNFCTLQKDTIERLIHRSFWIFITHQNPLELVAALSLSSKVKFPLSLSLYPLNQQMFRHALLNAVIDLNLDHSGLNKTISDHKLS